MATLPTASPSRLLTSDEVLVRPDDGLRQENVDPEARTVVVHRPGVEPLTLDPNAILDGGDVVPGFRCRVGDLLA